MNRLAQLDQAHVWHPFTQMRDWLRKEPIVIVEGQGAELRDVHGKTYLDANASIWTNLHGHRHPQINRAIERQLKKIAHSSALGLANEPASLLAAELVALTRGGRAPLKGQRGGARRRGRSETDLAKVFFSDDGSTALEVALKLAYEYARRTRGERKPRFLSLEGAYHGDTVGAVSLGHIDLFHAAYGGLLFKSDAVMAPYCYRCPYNRARPARGDARENRQCRMECVGKVERRLARQNRRGPPYAALVVEPRMQGAAGMIPQPDGWLREVSRMARAQGSLLIFDEIMTGFGRTGANWIPSAYRQGTGESGVPLFAGQQEGVTPDFLCLAKGLTGGYLPMAATLTTPDVFEAFLGEYEEFKTFFHGHSYTGNALGAAAARASLKLLETQKSVRGRKRLERHMTDELALLWALPNVGDVRQVGLVAGVELVRNWRTREPFEWREQAGIRVVEAMAQRGVITRPIGNVIVLMPPYVTTPEQLTRMVRSLYEGVQQVFGKQLL